MPPPGPGKSTSLVGSFQSLQFQLALLFLLLLVLLGAGAAAAAKYLVGDRLADDVLRQETENGGRLAAELRGVAQQAETMASMLGRLTVNQPGGLAAMHQAVPHMFGRADAENPVISLGIWPEPATLDPARDRASLYWVRDNAGQLQLHEDYNDARTVPYYRERWYTPAQYAEDGRCYWTPVYREPLARRDVISCAAPMRTAGGRFVGVVTVSIALESIAGTFSRASAGELGYSLLADEQGRFLAVSGPAVRVVGAVGAPRNLAELAQKLPAFNPAALAVFAQNRDLSSAVARSTLYKADRITALTDGTRELAREDAEAALTQIWSRTGKLELSPPLRVQLPGDAVLSGAAVATIIRVPDTNWALMRVMPARAGFAGAEFMMQQALVVSGGSVLLALVLVFAILQFSVIGPLRRMMALLAVPAGAEETLGVMLDTSARNEIGAIALWHNERMRQLRDMLDHVRATNLQLTIDSKERRGTQEQLARFQERASLALQSVSDGVITTDERGVVEELNPAAESMIGMALSNARGRPLAEVLVVRAGRDSSALPNMALAVIQRGTRLEGGDNLSLSSYGGTQREITLTAIPMSSRNNRGIGAVIIFREKLRSAAPAVSEVAPVDAITGLRGRHACDKRIRALIEAARFNPRRHALLLLDLDHLKRVNDNARGAGDEALAKVAEVLGSRTGNAGEVFRLHADHFVVVLGNSDAQRARTFAEALRETIAHTRLYWEAKYFGVTVSIGVTEFDGSDGNPVDVIRRADDACAAAKRAGRNTVKVYDSSMSRAGREADDATWVRRIRAGLDQNMFRLTTQYVLPEPAHAAEGNVFDIQLALEDEEGFWSPANAFMPTAGRHNLSAEIDRWMIARTLAELATNVSVLAKLAMVSMALSPESLADAGFVEFLAGQLQRSGAMKPRQLCFELTENDIVERPQEAQRLGDALRSIGYRLGIDRFLGHDTSNLALLRQLPADFVRIDGSRFRNLASDAAEQTLAISSARLARVLGKRVTIAGIEDGAQIDTWRRIGVDYSQGNAVAKPSPVIFQLPR